MSLTKYGSGSIYKQTPQTNFYLDNLVLPDLQTDPTDKAFTVTAKYDQKPYNLSYDLYGNKNYWWVFQILNMGIIRDPIYDFKTGITIRVPSKERIMSLGGTN
jgi:hypothetical protein